MQRIDDDWTAVKIEHYRSQSGFPDLQLEWKNLLATCPGGQGKPPSEQHCDTRKGRRPISLDPTNPKLATQVSYSSDGRVVGDSKKRSYELNEVLGLNLAFLCRNRKAMLDGFIAAMDRRDSRAWSARTLEKWLRDLDRPASGKLSEYVGVISWWIRKKTASRCT